ncbi:MAG: RodZ domain-containing protein [Syntrophales bacterium]|jgi:cytoskeleton protein RodZ|nr:DUF4115 domain-containing protein [Syntrophales bacterium]
MTDSDPHSLPAEHPPVSSAENGTGLFSARREQMGLSLADVYARTRISMKNLAALEQGDFDSLPPPVYTKAFIRQYADLLGIEARPLMEIYDTFLESRETPGPAFKADHRARLSPGFRFWKLVLFLIGLFVVIGAFFAFFYMTGQNASSPPNHPTVVPNVQPEMPAPPESVPASPPTEPPALHTPPPPPAAPTFQPEITPSPRPAFPPKPLAGLLPDANAQGDKTDEAQKLILKARETTWVGILIDGQEGHQMLLHPGDMVTYSGNQFRLDVGNAGGIDVVLQGKALPPLGKAGQVVHLTLP